MQRHSITAYIRCYQDPALVLRCANHVLWADEILIADNSQNDSVANIISQIPHKNVQYCRTPIVDWRQRLLGLKDRVNSDYILMVDTDEYYSEEAGKEILEALSKGRDCKNGYIVPSESYLYCEYFQKGADQLRLFKKDAFFLEMENVHEMPKVEGETPLLKHGYNHYNSPTLSFQLRKVLNYEVDNAKLLDGAILETKRTDKMSSFKIKLHFIKFTLRFLWRSKAFLFQRNTSFVHLWIRYLDFVCLAAIDFAPTEEAREREGKQY